MLEIKNLKLSYGSTQILNGVDLSVKRGDVVSIIGPSGTGKTTLLNQSPRQAGIRDHRL